MLHQAQMFCYGLPHMGEPVEMEDSSLCDELDYFISGESFSTTDSLPYLAFRFMSMDLIQCSKDGTLNMLIGLSNQTARSFYHSPLLSEKSLVAEGLWDHSKNRLCLLACYVHKNGDGSKLSVGECSLRLNFWFPTTFSLLNRSIVVGQMLSTEKTGDPQTIKLDSSVLVHSDSPVQGSRYKYTILDTAKKHCKLAEVSGVRKERYPVATSVMDMRFQISVWNVAGDEGWGDASLVSLDENFYGSQVYGRSVRKSIHRGGSRFFDDTSLSPVNENHTIQNISYAITYRFWNSKTERETVDISAEGVYNSKTGELCLLGCRLPISTYSLKQDSSVNPQPIDCEILIKIQLAPVSPKHSDNFGTGKITSTRDTSDPLYFKELKIRTSSMYRVQSADSIWRMDTEMILLLVSLTFLCFLTWFQLYHARKHRDVVPMMSITMLILLTLGHMIPLILNIESMLAPVRKQRDIFFYDSSWFDANQVVVRIMTMIVLFIQIRLLQLAWKSRSLEEGKNKGFRDTEWKVFKLCVPLYFAGALIAWFINSKFTSRSHPPLWKDLMCYLGLVLDGFLLPQIIFNIFSSSKEKVLTPLFYIGATVVRGMPHIYSAYRAWRFVVPRSTFIYANPREDYYSTAFNVIIPLEGMLFALLIYLQQRFGGRCFLPMRFKQLAGYEAIPTSTL